MIMNDEERKRFVNKVEEQVNIAKEALQRIAELADGKDGNVIFLALSKKGDLDVIVKCAKINK